MPVEGLCAGETIGSQDPQGTGDTGFDGLNHCCCGAVGVLCEGVWGVVCKKSQVHIMGISRVLFYYTVYHVLVFSLTPFSQSSHSSYMISGGKKYQKPFE
jgi:hypothetical protein